MTTTEIIIQHLKSLPESKQREVLDFVEFLKFRQQKSTAGEEDTSWSEFSLASAMRGMEDEETSYTLRDLKVNNQISLT